MQPAGIGIGWPWIAGLALLVLAGLFVIWRGLYPRRQGTTPYCRKCGYNLTGKDRTAEDARCPECGSIVTADDAVIFGERVRRWRRVFAGLVIFLLGAVPLVLIGIGVARGTDWYHYKPTALVLRDIQSSSPALATKAIREMTRRFNADALAPEQIAELAESCLAVHKRLGQQRTVGFPAMGLLDQLYTRELLTREQTERFFGQMIEFSALVRPRVVQGDPCFLGVKVHERGPGAGYQGRVDIEDVRVDDRTRSLSGAGPGWWLPRTVYLEYWEHGLGGLLWDLYAPGEHTAQIDVRFRIYERDGSQRSVPESSALHSERRTVNATFEVLEEEPPDLFKFTHSPELDRAVAARISLSEFGFDPDDLAGRFAVPFKPSPTGMVHFPGPHPIGLAFNVYAEIDGQHIGLGRITASKDDPGGIGGVGFALPATAEIPDKVTIILRSSKAAALRTPDLYEIWDGELWFEDVEVAPEKPTTQAWALGGPFKPVVRRRDPSDDQAWPAVRELFDDATVFSRSSTGLDEIDDRDLAAMLEAALSESQAKIELLRKLAERPAGGIRDDPYDIDVGEVLPESAAPTATTPDATFEEMIKFALRIRPVVVRGQEFVVGVAYEDRGPPRAYRLRIRVKQIRFGSGETLHPNVSLSTTTGFSFASRGRDVGTYTRLDKPGKWPVEVDVEYQINSPDSTAAWLPDSSALYSGKCTVTGEIEVLAEEPPDLLKLTHSPELDEAIVARLRLSEFSAKEQPGWGREARRRLQGTLWFAGPLPVGVAFEAFAEIGNQRVQSNWPIIGSPGGVAGTSHGVGVSFPYDGDPPETITVILRSSKGAAMRTPDLYEIWGGELRFDNVEVVPPEHVSWSQHDYRFAPRVTPREPATTQQAAEPQ